MRKYITLFYLLLNIVSQAQTNNLNNIIRISTDKINWSHYNPPIEGQNILLTIPIKSIFLIDYKLSKAIKGVRFNLIVMDAFNETLYSVEDLTIEFKVGDLLGNVTDERFVSSISTVPPQCILIKANTINDIKINSLYEYSQKYSIKLNCSITSILLADGDVLK